MEVVKIVPFPGVPGPQGPTGPQGATGPAGSPATFPNPVAWTPQMRDSSEQFTQGSNQSVGYYYNFGKLIFIHIEYSLANVSNFGTGQLVIQLPFTALREADVFGGTLHDESTSLQYSIKGHVNSGTNVMTLWSISTDTTDARDQAFTAQSPFSLSTEDSVHLSFWYEVV